MVYAPVAAAQERPGLVVRTLERAPLVDGMVGEAEYGEAGVRIAAGGGEVRVWVVRGGGAIYVAAAIPDSTFYWGDDLAVSLDPDGSGGDAPEPGDRQWYLRRLVDSSVVMTAAGGRWMQPGSEPPMLGAARQGADWSVASTSDEAGWSLELRIDERALSAGDGAPAIGFRTYDDAPRGWWTWPLPPAGARPQLVERTPRLWAVLDLQ